MHAGDAVQLCYVVHRNRERALQRRFPRALHRQELPENLMSGEAVQKDTRESQIRVRFPNLAESVFPLIAAEGGEDIHLVQPVEHTRDRRLDDTGGLEHLAHMVPPGRHEPVGRQVKHRLAPLHLVNGVPILKMEGMERIDYLHLEFDRHVVIFAEDAAEESFVDDDSRTLFHNADEYRRLYPDEPRGRFTEFCAPRVEEGAVLGRLHRILATRSAHLRRDTAAPWGGRGKVELATHALVAGWAFSGADAGPISLAILVNDAVVGRIVADRYRPDLEAAGIGDGRHGFRFRLPKGLSVEADHRIEVRREIDWALLSGAPVILAAGGRL